MNIQSRKPAIHIQKLEDLFPPERKDEAEALCLDLENVFWNEIKQAASASTWMPEEYVMNDWVSDVCKFLRDGAVAFPESPKEHKLLKRNISVLNLSTRTRNALIAAKIETVGKLVSMQPYQLFKQKGVGEAGLAECAHALERRGLMLGDRRYSC